MYRLKNISLEKTFKQNMSEIDSPQLIINFLN